MLEIKGIHKSFGDLQVLSGINLRLEKGLVYTLKGGNGSGKTTLINIISGFLAPTQGIVEFKGKKIIRFAPYRVNRLGIGRTFQDLRLATQMTVYENILLALEKKPFANPTPAQKKRVDEILEKVSLTEKKNELAGEISYGQQKLLTIGCCIANDADLLLIDEPVAGIDKDNLVKIITLVNQLKKEGKTILQIEHNNDYIQATSDRIIQMSEL
ncbi:MAG: branched-chain amino acid transport system ATP-binding protein [Candidatus Ordinivivax streblomastigis]|uniref:Branched-chain amino acid transport system ATP-binding protein n=1 Tax=Candidatus Ordinivivax streblomastigis TaxID=2540710 RepID=A0A5M8NZ60_9BACT|nr:MAG: branched-chain amino acid transport system ATP-binding protein [Candidatus Ordinivivax streblomastigis]